MPVRSTPWPPGTPCWVDLQTTDVAAAREFYGDLFGWEFIESGPEFGGYLLATAGGDAVAGIGPVMGDQPPSWTLYFASDDADATALAVTAAGGMVLAAPFDVGPLGRMAVALDPTGLVFGIWQAREHIGISRYNDLGALSWEEGWSPDVARAKEFYTAVFGFTYSPIPGAGDYWSFSNPSGNTDGLGGIGAITDDGPPRWASYISVPDAAAAVARTTAAGGAVLGGVDDTPFGRMAELVDAQGARFKVAAPPSS